MPISATGKPSQSHSRGFTLIEVLMVVVILAVVTAAGVQVMSGMSATDRMKRQAEQFVSNLQFMCEQALFENRAYGLEVLSSGSEVMTFQGKEWLPAPNIATSFDSDEWPKELRLQGQLTLLSATPKNNPHIMCDTLGMVSPFELTWLVTTSGETHRYQVKRNSQMKIDHGWSDE